MIGSSKDTLEVFKRDLWKDQRRLEKIERNGEACLVKHYISEREACHEIAILKHLSSVLRIARVPKIIEEGQMYAVLPYLSGIRVFNMLVELDSLPPPVDKRARQVKKEILDRCEMNQREIQGALITWSEGVHLDPYPSHKITTLVQLLADCLCIDVDHNRLDREIVQLGEIFTQGSTVPFRDATTKNMVIASSELWLGNFSGESGRRTFLYESLMNDSRPEWLDAPIYDFDFASCLNATTPEDDVVSLRFHERTWAGMPENTEKLVWHKEPDARRAAVTFFVRYYRFGGRKAAYRLLHPSGHRIRFRHDNDAFYFDRVACVMKHLWPEASSTFPKLLEFTDLVYHSLQTPIPSFDFFRANYEKTIGKRTYYVDMYPE